MYDVTGRRVRSLLDSRALVPGWQEYMWDARDDAGRPLAPGVYLARLETAAGTVVRRMVHLR